MAIGLGGVATGGASVNYKGQYNALTDLQTTFPVGQPGWFATLVHGGGDDVTEARWDSDDNQWVDTGEVMKANSASIQALQTNLSGKVDQSVYDAMVAGNATDAELLAVQNAQSAVDAAQDERANRLLRIERANQNMSGGGTITWTGNKLSTSQRIIWIPSGDGSGDHWNLTLSNLTVPNWHIAYLDLTDAETRAHWVKNQTHVKVVHYGAYKPGDNHLIIGHANGDAGDYGFYFANGMNTHVEKHMDDFDLHVSGNPSAVILNSARQTINADDPVKVMTATITLKAPSKVMIEGVLNGTFYYVCGVAAYVNGTPINLGTGNNRCHVDCFQVSYIGGSNGHMRAEPYKTVTDVLPVGTHTIEIGVIGKWAGTKRTMYLNNRSSNDMASSSSLIVRAL